MSGLSAKNMLAQMGFPDDQQAPGSLQADDNLLNLVVARLLESKDTGGVLDKDLGVAQLVRTAANAQRLHHLKRREKKKERKEGK